MRNLKPYDKAAIDFFDIVAAAKNTTKEDPNYKKRITGLRPAIIDAYDLHHSMFEANTLILSKALGYAGQDKADLLKLYHFPRKALQELKTILTTSEANTLVNTCQNCTINEINSFDHLLPKEEFPELAINPRNLFPSCSQCNGYKSVFWRDGSKMIFLNLYLNVLPDYRYLYTDICFDDGIKVRFVVRNDTGKIDRGLFEVILSHYTRLHLPERFSQNSGDEVTELIHMIESFRDILPQDQVVEVITSKIVRDLSIFGRNHWKSLLKLDLINNPEFHNYIKN